MLDEFADASGISSDICNGLRWSASLLLEPLQTIFDSRKSKFSVAEILKEKKNRKLWNMIVSHDVESLDEGDKNVNTGICHSTNKLLLKPMESDNRLVWDAKRRTELAVLFEWTRSKLHLKNQKKNEVLN